MRLLALVAVLLVLAAPASVGAALRSNRTGVLHGIVVRGPACSAGHGQPCSAGVSGIKIDFLHGGHAVAHTTTTSDGMYRIRLHAGSYGVQVPGHDHAQPTHARVKGERVTRLDITIGNLN